MAFPPSEVSRARQREDGITELEVYLLGLLGCSGPMPLNFTEYVFQRIHHYGDRATARFLDVFHHRMLSLYYRTWSDANPVVGLGEGEDRFGRYLASVAGLGSEDLAGRDAVPDTAKVYYGGLLRLGGRHAEGLVAIIAGFFGVQARIEEFVPAWLRLPQGSRCQLGGVGTLGSDIFVGERVRDCRGRFRIVLGPLSMKSYVAFLPGRKAARRLADWVRLYVGLELEWELQLVLRKEEVPSVGLDGFAMLGYTTWMPQTSERQDADDLVLGPFDSPG
jgi:type VI secretion system protein ImpH